jgi:tetratricopeptide (TPR) repeat protein
MTTTPPQIPAPAPERRLGWRLARAGMAFDAGVLELVAEQRPDDLRALVALGQAYARLGRHRQGLEVDRRLVAARPDEPVFRYNLACSLTLTGDLDGACSELLAAIDFGYRDFDHLDADDDLAPLRADGRFVIVQDAIDAVDVESDRGSTSSQSST